LGRAAQSYPTCSQFNHLLSGSASRTLRGGGGSNTHQVKFVAYAWQLQHSPFLIIHKSLISIIVTCAALLQQSDSSLDAIYQRSLYDPYFGSHLFSWYCDFFNAAYAFFVVYFWGLSCDEIFHLLRNRPPHILY